MKLWSALLCLLFCASASAQTKKPLVVATASMFADMAHQIGGDLIEVRSIVPVGGDPHIYSPVPGDAELARKADLILRNGLTFEGWLGELIANSGTKATVVLITEGIDVIRSDTYHNAADPHAWMSAANGLIYIHNIYEALRALLPEHEAELRQRYERYRAELQALDAWIATQIDSIPPQWRILITSHDAFQYYGRRYGLRLESVLGTSTDADVQTSDIVRLYDVLDQYHVPAIFVESTINPKLLQQIARDKKVAIGGKLYADSLGPKGSPADTYVGMLRHNTLTIARALRGLLPREALAAFEAQSTPAWLWLLLGLIQLGSLAWVARVVWHA